MSLSPVRRPAPPKPIRVIYRPAPLVGLLSAVLDRLQVQLPAPIEPAVTEPTTTNGHGPEWLSVEQVGIVFNLSPRWLSEHKRELARRQVISQPSRKVRLFHRERLARMLEASARNGG